MEHLDEVTPAGKSLTPKQEAFVREYLIDLNATQAAIRAGYSEDTAGAIGHENLKKPEIATRIERLMDARSKRVQLDADRVLQEIAAIGFAKLDAAGMIQEMEKLVAEGLDPRALARLSYPDKLKALELLGKHLKLFTDKHEHSGPDGGPIQVKNLSGDQIDARIAALLAKGKKTDASDL